MSNPYKADSVIGGRLANGVAELPPPPKPLVGFGSRLALALRLRQLLLLLLCPPGTSLCYDLLNRTEENREECLCSMRFRPHRIRLKALRNSGLKTV